MLGLPKLSSDPVGFWTFFLGTLRDAAGANHGSPTAIHWLQNGAVDGVLPSGITGRIDIADAVPLRLTSMGWYLYSSRGFRQSGTQTLADKAVGNYRLQLLSDRIRLTGGGVNSDLVTAAFVGAKSIAVSLTSGGVPTFYGDHASLGVGDTAITPATGTDALDLLGDGASPVLTACEIALATAAPLTVADLTALDTYAESRITPRKQWPGGGLRYPDRETELVTDWDMVDKTKWTVSNAAILTNVDDGHQTYMRMAYDGSNNPGALESGVVSVGSSVTIEARMRGDGNFAPKFLTGDGSLQDTGTASTDWQILTASGISGNATIFVRSTATGAGYADVDYIKVWDSPPGYTPRTGDPMFLDNIQTARVTLADQASGQLSNTGLEIVTGTWALTESAAGRAITCVVAGRLKPVSHLVGADTWTTRLFTETGGVTLTKNAADFTLDAVAGDTITALQLTAP